MRSGGAIAIVLGLSASARADHHHAIDSDGDAPFAVGVSLIAATYSPEPFYGGDYEGAVPSVRWASGRFAAAASLPLYRLESNGITRYGLGDALVQGQVKLYTEGAWSAGAALAVTLPSGVDFEGFGMGHPMVMPAAIGGWSSDGVTIGASAGYGRALADLGGHDHGMWPLVEPMNMSELELAANGDVMIARGLHGGVRVSAGVPIAAQGRDRVIGAARIAWGTGRVESGAEIQVGLVGDPFTVRGIIDTALRF
jgi:hypothetical protein